MTTKTANKFQRFLLNWYDDNARCLPWRDDPTPYRVWISEIMLQQTRVEAVKPYFDRFLAALPTVKDLAGADEGLLLKLWEGLGYYSRVRNLKKAAIQLMDQYEGKLPSSPKELAGLPGIGPYTAGAISSIAYGIRAAAIDGNVTRVVARLTANSGDPARKETKSEIGEAVQMLLPEKRIGDFNQALMELGAVVCLPNGAPKCDVCPVFSLCGAYAGGLTGEIPAKTGKKARKIEKRTVLLLRCKDRTALAKRPGAGLLAGLWEFPNLEGHLSDAECKTILKEWNLQTIKMVPLEKAKHIFSHIEWHMTGFLVHAEELVPIEEPIPVEEMIQRDELAEPIADSPVERNSSRFVWASPEDLRHAYSIPSAFKAYMEYACGKEA